MELITAEAIDTIKSKGADRLKTTETKETPRSSGIQYNGLSFRDYLPLQVLGNLRWVEAVADRYRTAIARGVSLPESIALHGPSNTV